MNFGNATKFDRKSAANRGFSSRKAALRCGENALLNGATKKFSGGCSVRHDGGSDQGLGCG
jgi:hypothetical protein